MHRKLSRLELADRLSLTKKDITALESSSPLDVDKKTLSKILKTLDITQEQLVSLETAVKQKNKTKPKDE